MKKITLCAAVLLLFSLPGCTRTIQSEKPVDNGPVYEEVLSNGLKVFIIHDRNAPLAVFQIWYDAGSGQDAQPDNGPAGDHVRA